MVVVSDLSRLTFLAFVLLVTLLVVKPVAAGPNAVIQNDTSYVDISGSYHVVGEVKNTGDVWLQSIQISATLKDRNGATVDIKSTSIWPFRLPPNVALGFDATELNKTLSATIGSYTLTLASYELSEPKSVFLRIGNLTSSKNNLGWLEVQGQVTNTGDSISEDTIITGTFYGTDGKVVYVASTFLNRSTTQPGISQSFTLVVDPTRGNLVSRYSVAAESLQYTSVPELPWQPTIIAAVALVLSLFVIRRRPQENHIKI